LAFRIHHFQNEEAIGMVLLSFRWRALAGCLLLTAVVVSTAYLAAGPAPETEKKPSPVDKVRKALDEPMTLEVTDQPLAVALNQIRDKTKLNFVVDRVTIQQLGYDPEQIPVNVKLKDVKARSCLRSLLGPYNLGYAIIGDTVVISTDDMVTQRQMKQRVSIDLDKVDFVDALKQLSRDTATSIILDPRVAKDVKTKVTLELDDVPLENAVKLMAESAGLKPVRVGNVLFVTSKANAVAMRADAAETQPDLTPPADYPKDKAKE
jgi:type II secretory pathway component GspD/PulD (secretin)